jgi:hypothetical protein
MPAVYRFRVTFEDYDDVYRDIEIKSKQTFEDLHKIIQKSINFDSSQLASFYMSDDNWGKGQEITLMDMSEPDMDDEDERPGNKKPAPITMKDARLADFILDPHQKIYYVFDFMAMWTFYVELIKIIPGPDNGEYPRVVRSVHEAPKQYGGSALGAVNEEFDFLHENGIGSVLSADEEALPEGEEGEESTVDDLDLESPDFLKDQDEI